MDDRIEITIDGQTETLFFGTLAVKIFTIKTAEQCLSIQNAENLTQEELLGCLDQDEAFSYLVHAGLSNYAKIKELPLPTYEHSYLFTEKIILSGSKDLHSGIISAYENSRATQAQIAKLPKSDEKKKKLTGTKSKVMPIPS